MVALKIGTRSAKSKADEGRVRKSRGDAWSADDGLLIANATSPLFGAGTDLIQFRPIRCDSDDSWHQTVNTIRKIVTKT
jgi:hypothetical protein